MPSTWRRVGVPAEVSALVEQVYRRARAQYGDAGGEMLPIKLYEDLTRTPLRGRPELAMSHPGSTLITRIGELVTNDPDHAGFTAVTDAALIIEDATVAWTGPAAGPRPRTRRSTRRPGGAARVRRLARAPGFRGGAQRRVRGPDGRAPVPGGRHPHHGGSDPGRVRCALRANLRRLAAEMLRQGTTTFECKSGYGLTVVNEARALALAAEITPETTFLGAHVVPPEFAGDVAGYVDLVCGPMLDACAPYARWVDVFCEHGAFGADEAAAVLAAGRARGLGARVHANQLGPGPASGWRRRRAPRPPTTAPT